MAWRKFNDPKVPGKQKVSYLHLTMEAHESMINLTANGASVLAIRDITNRARRLGIDSNNTSSSPLSEDQEMRNYMKQNGSGSGTDMDLDR